MDIYVLEDPEAISVWYLALRAIEIRRIQWYGWIGLGKSM